MSDFIFFEQMVHAPVQFGRDCARSLDHLLPVVADIVCLDPPIGSIVFEPVVKRRCRQQGLGGNTAPVQTDPPEFVRLDTGNFHAQLGGADRADVSTGATANHDQIKLLIHSHIQTLGLNSRRRIVPDGFDRGAGRPLPGMAGDM